MLCATTRRAPAAAAARTSVPATSRRSRLVRSKPRLTVIGLADRARLVSWLITTSGDASCTARVRDAASKASPTAGTTSGTPRAATFPAWRENTVTSCPAAARAVTRGRPMAPVPPATKMRTRAGYGAAAAGTELGRACAVAARRSGRMWG